MIQQTATELTVPYDEIAGCGVRVALAPAQARMFVSSRFEPADNPAVECDDLHVCATGLVHDLTVAQAQRRHDVFSTPLERGGVPSSTRQP